MRTFSFFFRVISFTSFPTNFNELKHGLKASCTDPDWAWMWQADNVCPQLSHHLPKFFPCRLHKISFLCALLPDGSARPIRSARGTFSTVVPKRYKWSSVIANEEMEWCFYPSSCESVCVFSLQVVSGGQSWSQCLAWSDSSDSSSPPPSLCRPPVLVVFQWRALSPLLLLTRWTLRYVVGHHRKWAHILLCIPPKSD